MGKQGKHNAAWGIVALFSEPLYLYLAILGVGRFVGADVEPPIGWKLPLHGVLPIGWKFPLIVILVMVHGMLYIRTCVRTLRSLKHGPQADLSKLELVARIVWFYVSFVFVVDGIIQLSEAHPVLFARFSRLGAFLALFVVALLVRLCVRSSRAFVQGMREAK